MSEHFDVGIVGWWYNLNYGGTLTYYALNRALEKMGYSVAMIEKSCPENYIPDQDTVPRHFADKHYKISPRYTYTDMHKLNELCDAFIAGSDQLWNPYLMTWSGPEYFLSFADASKKKIAYSTSFGNIDHCSPDFINKYKPLLDRFDAISLREDYAVDICKSDFGISAVQVCDPVFLCDKEDYEQLTGNYEDKYTGKYVLNFLLDPDQEKVDICRSVRKKLGVDKFVNFTDLQDVQAHIEGFCGEYVNANAEIEEFITAYKNAEFIVTDSFHGTCFAILFNKPFISLANKRRGAKRFISLMNWIGLSKYLVNDYSEVYENESLFDPIDYDAVKETIRKTRRTSINWLKFNIDDRSGCRIVSRDFISNRPKTKVELLNENPDFIKIRILATLLRDYGIKHIVLSPGGRDVPLVRMFEYNQDSFILHSVTDERSAAYYGLGLAAQLGAPVVCVCTSGTAASNYLPAVTEAYYTGIPLIMITADRRSVYHEQGEDQTIPQSHIYDGVIKKSVTLPEGTGFQPEYQTRRDVSDCILEATHNGNGPVHINIAIENITIGADLPRANWELLPFIKPHIMRVGPSDGEKKMLRWVDSLKKSPRILVVYGQNPRPNDEQLKNIEKFAERYNCVIVTDFISNLDCEYSLKPYNMLQKISQKEFNEHLSPDILISVGGKRLMNDPLTFKIRGGYGAIRHWSVIPDGKVKDFYFRLTSIIETNQDYFFKWFADHAEECRNDNQYYNVWKEYTEKYSAPEITKFNAHYVQSKFIPTVPAGSMLHLGVGQSFFDSRRYTMNKNVEVFCNMGTNGIDGCTSTFLGQCAVAGEKLCFLIVGDLSFFYDMNSIWNKPLTSNIRILMVNNNGTGLLSGHRLKNISSVHNTQAKGWVESTGFEYMSACSKEEYEEKLGYFLSDKPQRALFFEVFCE